MDLDADSSLTINNLPTEVLDKIFSHLTFYDVKAVKGVCRRWLDITLHSSYTRHNKINIRNFKFLPRTAMETEGKPDEIGLSFIYQTVKLNFKEYQTAKPNFIESPNEYDEFERDVKWFMKCNGENVKNLTLIDFHATKEPRLYKLCSEIIDAAPNLVNLCLHNSQFDHRLFLNGNGETNRGARNLKHLSLVPWSLRLVEYDQLGILERNLPKLQGLTWLNAHTAFDEKALEFFKLMPRRLKSLKVHNLIAEELMLEKNFPILSEFRLESLDMKFDTSVVPPFMFAKFVEFIKNQRNTLTDLTLYCSDLIMPHLSGIYSALIKLERLKVVYDGVNEVDLAVVLSQPRQLKVLEIYVEMPNDFDSVIQPIKNDLRVMNCNVCASAQFLSVINNFTNLVALRVTLFKLPTLDALSTFYSSLTRLKYLYLGIALKITDNSEDAPLQYNISNLKRLQCLAVITKENSYVPGCEFEQIAKLKCLEKLVCKIRVKPSDALFDEFFDNAKSLNHLDVRQSPGIDDDGVEKIFQSLNHLSYIGFSGCVNIKDRDAALDRMRSINNRVRYNNDFLSENFDEEFISKYIS